MRPVLAALMSISFPTSFLVGFVVGFIACVVLGRTLLSDAEGID